MELPTYYHSKDIKKEKIITLKKINDNLQDGYLDFFLKSLSLFFLNNSLIESKSSSYEIPIPCV